MNERGKRMSWVDRLIIEKLFNTGRSYRYIASELGFAVSSVYAEIKRGLYTHREGSTWKEVKRYSAQIAEDDSLWQATARGGVIKLGGNYEYAKSIASRILAGESPDVIVGSMRKKGTWTVSTTTLYRYIDQGYIPDVTNKNLLVKAKKKRSYRKLKKASKPPKGKSIERRSEEISSRCTFGHWEMDTVIGKAKGKGQALLVLTERLTRFELIYHLRDKSASAVVHALNRIMPNFPKDVFKSITVDNGGEFQDCYGIEHTPHGKQRTTLYYCHPYSSWERGSNENANRLIRRFLPKGKSLTYITQRECRAIADFMNNLPRRILDYSTPSELFEQELVKL